jgi:beta-lactamase class A
MPNHLVDEQKKVTINQALLLTLLAGAFALGIFFGAATGMFTPVPAGKGEATPERTDGAFKFIQASLEAKNPRGNRPNRELKPFQYKVNALTESILKKNDASAISVYFRDLNNGNWFGIGEHAKFSPKSLLKLPLMIAYFKWAETNPLVLRRRIPYAVAGEPLEQKHSKPTKELEPGKSYTVNDLVYRMIAYDDDAAYALLYSKLPAGRLEKVFKDLYVDYDPNKEEDALSLSSFAAFYRVLFNASYLSEEMSEKALRYLSRSTFRDGMASGIPPNIDIASKHGERTILLTTEDQEQTLFQLHEFGIIYYPNRPFLLGISARGEDYHKLVGIIRDITRLVYEEIDRQS